MSSENRPSEKATQKYGWIILFALAVLLALNTAFILIRGTDPDVFMMDTGVAWSEFSTAYPTVATFVTLLERLLSAGILGFCLYAAIITYLKFRKGERWAWYTMWLFPGMLALLAALLYLHNEAYVGIYYLVAAALAVVGMLVPVRKFFPKAGP